nr:DNA internalization-related competence protein ComEC/Rec2 [Desulfoprunum benzoelyticum]
MPIPPSPLAVLTGATMVVTLTFYLRRRTFAAHLSLLNLFLLLGVLHGIIANRSPSSPDHIFNLIEERREAVVIATLVSMPTYTDGTGRATVELESIRFADRPDFQRAEGKVLVRIMEPWPDFTVPGTMLALRLNLQRPSRFNTPGTFNYPAHLARQGIRVTGHLSSSAYITRIPASTKLLHQLRFFPERLRHTIGAAFDDFVPAPLNGIYRALVIGDQTQVDDATRNLFRDSGVMHILSISGLHFAIIATILYMLIFWLLRRSTWLILRANVRKTAMLACLPILLFYAFLAGMNIPVLRSLVMSCIAIVALCTDRRKSISTLLAVAALLILLVRPQALFTASFQLSFAAVAFIALTAPALRRLTGGKQDQESASSLYFQRFLHWVAAALLVSVAATLGTAPLLLYHFNHLSLIAPLTNLLVEPLICLWSLPCALLACLALPVSPDLASTLLHLGAPGLTISLKSMELFTQLPHSSAWLPTPRIWLIFVYYTAFLLLICHWRKNRTLFIAAVAFFTSISFLFIFPPYELTKRFKKDLTVSFLDVGQGSATLLEFPGGYRVLIDGGGSSASSRTVGETVIAPFLWHKGIARLDHIVVTHPDSDHYNGLPFVLERFSPAVLWTNSLAANDRPYAQLLEQARRQRMQVSMPTRGERLEIGRGRLKCIRNLSAGSGARPHTGVNRNDSGLVIQARLGRIALLFPGDISQSIERRLTDTDEDLAATILLSPHHGSKTSNSQTFLAAVAPEYLIVSASSRRSAHFPHPRLERQCEDLGITMMTTGRDGTIITVTDGNRFTIATSREPGSDRRVVLGGAGGDEQGGRVATPTHPFEEIRPR